MCYFYSKAADGKVLAQVFLEFKGNTTAHLVKLIAQLAKGKIGKLPALKALIYAGMRRVSCGITGETY